MRSLERPINFYAAALIITVLGAGAALFIVNVALSVGTPGSTAHMLVGITDVNEKTITGK